jgi:hypothetical protein
VAEFLATTIGDFDWGIQAHVGTGVSPVRRAKRAPQRATSPTVAFDSVSMPRCGPFKPGLGLIGEVDSLNAQPYTLAEALKSLKQGVARQLIGDAEHFWQKRYYLSSRRKEESAV